MAAQASHSSEIVELESETSAAAAATTTTQNQHKQLSKLATQRIGQSLKSMLTRFHAGYFRISLSLGGQALLWKTLIVPTDHANPLHHLFHLFHPTGCLVLWSFALFVLILLSLIYIMRCLFLLRMVKAEFSHHVGVNYLFAPWISWLLLLQSAPFMAPKTVSYLVLWWIFTVPVVALDIKIYGQWFTKGKRFLSMVANPTSQLSVIGNLVGAQAAANMGWKETAVCLFSLGIVHYFVLFVTLYQRFSGSDKLPAMLRPVFFLFLAAPSVACLAWEAIVGSFDIASKMLFFLSLFLFTSLVCRPTLFKRSMRRFNVAWWAYSFPLTVLAMASSEYAREVKTGIAHALMLLLSAFSVLVFLSLAAFTAFNTRMLLPDNDPIVDILNRLPTVSVSV
ncbi:hypothetical protein JCGZ_04506 [Jatropha curcas]|uniref:JHL18I08.15 protein n=1 Tax=Jatropha curcas TaxID=180498 RepID=E6NU71_JATCU|nr:hypothetical protein JCGZ_04506 [Jatropha curcas]BAJ53181.1 JHL18I08.15 [Jatropha curcas]